LIRRGEAGTDFKKRLRENGGRIMRWRRKEVAENYETKTKYNVGR